jgi:hypothetical protein
MTETSISILISHTEAKWRLILENKVFISSTEEFLSYLLSGFGGLEVPCWPLEPKFAGSNPAEAVGLFRAKKKSSARLP